MLLEEGNPTLKVGGAISLALSWRKLAEHKHLSFFLLPDNGLLSVLNGKNGVSLSAGR